MTEDSLTTEPIAVIFCDDVRREENGKEILIGVYSGAAIFTDFPARISAYLWMQFKTKGTGEVVREVRGLNSDGAQMFSGEFGASVGPHEEGTMSVPIGKLALQINGPGTIEFQIREKDGEWTTVLVKEVRKGPVPGIFTETRPNASQQPS